MFLKLDCRDKHCEDLILRVLCWRNSKTRRNFLL